jgi:molybdenum cofactor cytidylyltransferase
VSANPRFHSVSAIVLAAGLSRRAHPHNKLLIDNGGKPLIRSTVEAVCTAQLAEVIVVVGHQNEYIQAALQGLPLTFIFASDFEKGMGHSLAAGVRAVRAETAGLLVTVADLSGISTALVNMVLNAFAAADQRFHLVPTYQGQRGHPVVLGSWIRAELEQLDGDIGAKSILDSPSERIRTRFLEIADEALIKDRDYG